jgi:hypothetical protein
MGSRDQSRLRHRGDEADITCEAIVQKVEDMLISKEPPFLERKRAKLQRGYY